MTTPVLARDVTVGGPGGVTYPAGSTPAVNIQKIINNPACWVGGVPPYPASLPGVDLGIGITLIPGSNISIDSSDPSHPIISSGGGPDDDTGYALTANNLGDLASAPTARTNLGLGTAATHAATDFDASGAATTEQIRALAAEALLAPKASPTFTGTPLAPTAAALTNTTQVATTAYVDAGDAVVNALVTEIEADLGEKMVNPMTSNGDIIYEAGGVSFDLVAGGAVTSDGFDSGQVPAHAVDGNDGTFWAGADHNGHWIAFDATVPTSCNSVRIVVNAFSGAQNFCTEWKLQGSADNATWVDVLDMAGLVPTFIDTTRTFAPATYRYWRLLNVSGAGDRPWLNTWNLFTTAGAPVALPVGAAPQGLGISGGVPAWVGDTAWHVIGAGGQPAFAGTWVNNGGGDPGAQFRKTSAGMVVVMGAIKSGTDGTTAFVLPAGYRPLGLKEFVCWSSGAGAACLVTVDSAGNVVPQSGSGEIFLDGVSFFAEA